MNKEAFVKYIEAERENWNRGTQLRKLGVDIRPNHHTPTLALYIFMSQEQISILEWWFYDQMGIDSNPQNECIWDKDGNPIDVKTPEALFDYILSLGEPK